MSEGTNIAALAQQMATLTSRRDEYELALSMLALYNNFLSTAAASLFSVKHDGTHWLMKESANLQGATSAAEWVPLPTPLELFCNHTDHKSLTLEDGIWLPIYRRKRLINMVYLDATAPEPHEWLLIEGLLKIQENFIRLLDDAERDTLTGLRNRRTFDEKLFTIIEQRQNPVALALIDIDHFKHINDHWGHIIGDETLLRLSQQMEQFFQGLGTCYRYGGEEFAIILRANQPDCLEILDKFRQQIAVASFPPPKQVTVSIGFTMVIDQMLPINIIEQADRALYHAKDSGRNTVTDFGMLANMDTGILTPSSGDIELF